MEVISDDLLLAFPVLWKREERDVNMMAIVKSTVHMLHVIMKPQ